MAVPIAAHLASNVRKLREARGLTQQQMAKLSGVPRPTWANLESGTANPTIAVLARVAATPFRLFCRVADRLGVRSYPQLSRREAAVAVTDVGARAAAVAIRSPAISRMRSFIRLLRTCHATPPNLSSATPSSALP